MIFSSKHNDLRKTVILVVLAGLAYLAWDAGEKISADIFFTGGLIVWCIPARASE